MASIPGSCCRNCSSQGVNRHSRHHKSKDAITNGDNCTTRTPFAQPQGLLLALCENSDAGVHTVVNDKIGVASRIRCFTWTWFTMTMATGGVANVIDYVPYRFIGLTAIGTGFVILNMILFTFNVTAILLRFWIDRGSFIKSFHCQSESLFIPCAVVSMGIILMNIAQYGLPHMGIWLDKTTQVLFWLYAAVALITSSVLYLVLWSIQTFPVSNMTPVWILPAYPLLIVGPITTNILNTSTASLAQNSRLEIALGALTIQGIGFLLSLMIYAAFIYRLMTQKLPVQSIRPGMFVSVGPSGFTVVTFLGLSRACTTTTAAGAPYLTSSASSPFVSIIPLDFMGIGNGPTAAFTLRVLGNMAGLWLWGLCIWFFVISVGAHWNCMTAFAGKEQLSVGRKSHFTMSWYSFVFPNTALVTATLALGRAFENDALQWVGTAMAVLLVGIWTLVFGSMLHAVITKQLLWPARDMIDVDKMRYYYNNYGEKIIV